MERLAWVLPGLLVCGTAGIGVAGVAVAASFYFWVLPGLLVWGTTGIAVGGDAVAASFYIFSFIKSKARLNGWMHVEK